MHRKILTLLFRSLAFYKNTGVINDEVFWQILALANIRLRPKAIRYDEVGLCRHSTARRFIFSNPPILISEGCI